MGYRAIIQTHCNSTRTQKPNFEVMFQRHYIETISNRKLIVA